MKFNYSICYPDTPEIKEYPDHIKKEEIKEIFDSIGWDSELKKGIDFYNPSLDILRLKDNTHLVLSAFGNESLETFQVMLIIKSKNYCANFSVSKTRILLDQFLDGYTTSILDKIVVNSEKQSSIKSLSLRDIWIARLGSLVIIMFLTFVGLSMIRDQIYGVLFLGIIVLLLIFIVGSILFERKLRRSN